MEQRENQLYKLLITKFKWTTSSIVILIIFSPTNVSLELRSYKSCGNTTLVPEFRWIDTGSNWKNSLKMFGRLILFYLFCVVTVNCYDLDVKTGSGPVRGVLEKTLINRKNYLAFKGIPYAKPPLGELRFKVHTTHSNCFSSLENFVTFLYIELGTCSNSTMAQDDCSKQIWRFLFGRRSITTVSIEFDTEWRLSLLERLYARWDLNVLISLNFHTWYTWYFLFEKSNVTKINFLWLSFVFLQKYQVSQKLTVPRSVSNNHLHILCTQSSSLTFIESSLGIDHSFGMMRIKECFFMENTCKYLKLKIKQRRRTSCTNI